MIFAEQLRKSPLSVLINTKDHYTALLYSTLADIEDNGILDFIQ